jgi:hypothetical protein
LTTTTFICSVQHTAATVKYLIAIDDEATRENLKMKNG